MAIPITVYGDVDERAVRQLERCARAGDAIRAALCADGHVGYSQPIGGAVAYPDHISPSGVGYDIGCIAEGTPVLRSGGRATPIEQAGDGAVVADENGRLRPIEPQLGVVARGAKPVVQVRLANGRAIRATPDHRFRTQGGWTAAGDLTTGDFVLCPVHTGNADTRDDAVSRLAGMANGDGHLTSGRVAIYSADPRTIVEVARDLMAISGRSPSLHVRSRPRTTEHCVYLDDRPVVERLVESGAIVGRKAGRWPRQLPDHVDPRSYLSAFVSAEGAAPSLIAGRVASVLMKQKGRDAATFVCDVVERCGFTASATISEGDVYAIQILGGASETIRCFEEIGFCYDPRKRKLAAHAAAFEWRRRRDIERRSKAQARMRELMAAARVRDAARSVAREFGITESAAIHLAYRKGALRRSRGWTSDARALGECCWVGVESVAPDGVAETYDVITADPAEAFIAGGTVVHNCGNKAARTDLLVDDVADSVPRIMDAVFERISFGMGRKNDEPVDHPVLDAIRRADFAPQRKLHDVAASQLGTVGAGNHYVDLFAGDDGHLWVGVHFGSRGFGHKTASGFLALAEGRGFDERVSDGEMDSPPKLLAVDSELGQAYISAMQLAGEYAYAGRDTVVAKVLEILGARSTYEVHNHHNYCIAGDQIVPTTSGPKRMDEIVEGDEVYAYSRAGPQPTRVVACWRSGDKPIYTISLGTRRLRCSSDHRVMVVADGVVAWRAAEDLAVGDIVVCADGYYPTTMSWGLDRARLVGAFLGDGWIRHEGAERRGYALGLAIGTGAEGHTHRYAAIVADLLPNTGWGKGWQIDAAGHFGLSCSSKSAWDAAVAMGLGQRSAAKAVPQEAFSLPCDEKVALLGGYFDADGSVGDSATSNHGRGTIASVSRRLVAGLREIAVSCGLQVTPIRNEIRTTNYGRASVYSCCVAAGSMASIPLWHERKARNQRLVSRRTKKLTAQYLGGVSLPDGFFARRVRSIEVSAPEAVYDLTVDHDSHSFIVEGVVTHNCWRERHFGADVWVIRKGCTPAFPGQEGFVGATMGEPSVILRGVDSEGARDLLYSTVHGAGRVMSRTRAAGKSRRRWACPRCDWFQGSGEHKPGDGRCPRCGHPNLAKRFVQLVPGAIDFDAVRASLAARGVELRGGAADEAPDAYKRLDAVLAAHGDTVEVVHRLTPIGVAMASADTVDPYKD